MLQHISLAILVASVIDVLALCGVFYLVLRHRDWRIGFLPILTAFAAVHELGNEIPWHFDSVAVFGLSGAEVHGLAFSILLFLAVFFLERWFREHRRSEQALKDSEARFRNLIDGSLQGIFILDPSWKPLFVNQSGAEMFGFVSPEEVLALDSVAALVAPHERERLDEYKEARLRGERTPAHFELLGVRRDGRNLWLQVHSRIVTWHGRRAIQSTVIDITEQKQSEEALKASQQRFKDIAEAASDWFWEMDENFRFSYFSERLVEVTGIEPERLLGKTRREVGAADADDEKWRRHYAELDAHRPFRDFRYKYLGRDGRVQYWSISGKPVFDAAGTFRGYRGTGTDITAEVVAQARAERAETRLAEAIEALSEGFALFDDEDRLVLANNRMREMFPETADLLVPGVAYADMARAAAERGVFPEAIGRIDEWVAERVAGHRNPTEPVEQRLSDGRWVLISERPTRDGGIVAVRADITELKKREVELQRAKEQAEIANRTKTEFLANMSHELRTPLTAINGFAEVLESEMFGPHADPRYRQYATDIRESGQHLLAIINDILDVAKVEAGKVELREEPVSIEDLFEAALRLVKERAEANGLSLAIDIGRPLTLMVDPRLIKQILVNLLSNAVKFTPPGGRITLRASRDADGGIVITVTDTGIGIPAEELPRVMKPFQQMDGSLARKHEGTGLGLPLAKDLTEIHGGALEIESEPGVGTTVIVRLPAERVLSLQAAE